MPPIEKDEMKDLIYTRVRTHYTNVLHYANGHEVKLALLPSQLRREDQEFCKTTHELEEIINYQEYDDRTRHELSAYVNEVSNQHATFMRKEIIGAQGARFIYMGVGAMGATFMGMATAITLGTLTGINPVVFAPGSIALWNIVELTFGFIRRMGMKYFHTTTLEKLGEQYQQRVLPDHTPTLKIMLPAPKE